MITASAVQPGARERLRLVAREGAGARLLSRSVEVRLLDTALALASRLFVAVIPLALMLSAILPTGETLSGRIVATLDLEGVGRTAAISLFATPSAVKAGMTAATCLVVIYSLASCAGVLQRAYRAAWQLEGPERAWRGDLGRRLLWALALALYVGASLGLADASFPPLLDLVAAALRVGLAVGFFAWTPYLLLGRRVPARRLVPTAVLSAVSLATVTLLAPLYIPAFATANASSYGLVGFAFTFLTWLFTQSILIVGAAVVGAEIGSPAPAAAPNPDPATGAR